MSTINSNRYSLTLFVTQCCCHCCCFAFSILFVHMTRLILQLLGCWSTCNLNLHSRGFLDIFYFLGLIWQVLLALLLAMAMPGAKDTMFTYTACLLQRISQSFLEHFLVCISPQYDFARWLHSLLTIVAWMYESVHQLSTLGITAVLNK